MPRSIAAVLGLASALVGQDPTVFTVNREVIPERVSADRDAITAYGALEELGKALGWRVIPETPRPSPFPP